MPLPDAPDYSKRIYELLKETDLENLSYAQFQGVAEKLFIEPENEDEMRRLVLVQLARMSVRGDWDGFLTGASAAPVTSLIAGTNVTLDPVTGLGDVTINATGEIGGTITNDQIARGATAANDIEGSNGLLFDGTSFTINTLSASDPIVNIGSSTKSVSLEVNTNQKLSVKGSANSFVFDASSASGGITFPDSTVQNTAASAGTNYVINGLVSETPSTYSIALMENLTNQGGTGFGDRSLDVDSMTDSSGSFFYYAPFNASSTGTLASVVARCTAAVASATVEVAFYDSDSDGNPQTLIGTASLDMSNQVHQNTQSTITAASTGSMDLTKGGLYWCGVKQGGIANSKTLGYYAYESANIGSNITGSGTSAPFTGYNVLIGPATPPTTFSLLSVGQRQRMNLGGLYS
ncbi:MAG: hypothetical protein HOA20_01830 [Rhodobacterales bacterium]|nr:hypothetical protein [Rhodobacterales bacterium]